MKRTNTFVVRPLTDDDEQVLRQVLDASAALWNEINYQRLMRYNDQDGFEGDVWDADTGHLEGQYKGVLGASTAQQVIAKNSEAWRSFFRLKDEFHDPDNQQVTEHPEPPGFRGNEDDGADPPTLALTPIVRDLLGVENPSEATKEAAADVFDEMDADDFDGEEVTV